MSGPPWGAFQTAARAFRAGRDPAGALRVLAELLARVEPDGVDALLRALPPGGERTSRPLAGDGPDLRLALFLLPQGAVLPLHDHPGMHVLSHVVRGRLRLCSWSWEGAPRGGLARRTGVRTLGPRDPAWLSAPSQDNLHRLEALEPTAFLDLFFPDYDPAAGRDCAYFAELATPDAGPGALVRLRRLS